MVFKIGSFNEHKELVSLLQPIQKSQFQSGRQLAMTCRQGCSLEEAWTDGLTVSGEYIYDNWAEKEKLYNSISPHFQNELIEGLYEYLDSLTPFLLGRWRLMRLAKSACYTMHTDLDLRLQIPIVTNPEALIIMANGPVYHLPADGCVYLLDGRHPHTAINGGGGGEARLHIVVSLVANSPEDYDRFLSQSALAAAPFPSGLSKVNSCTAKKVFR